MTRQKIQNLLSFRIVPAIFIYCAGSFCNFIFFKKLTFTGEETVYILLFYI